jgi:hypothetical protein
VSRNRKAASADAELEEQIKNLTPEQAEMFVRALELAMKKRRLMLIGHLGAIVAMIAGGVWALYQYAAHEPGTFIGWVFLVPIAGAGAMLFGFGRLARRLGTRGQSAPPPAP